MPPIEVGPSRASSAIDARLARTAGGEGVGAAAPAAKPSGTPAKTTAASPAANQAAAPAVQTSPALDPGKAPIDTDRVAVIRKAVEEGSYPVIPMRVADAMIAAGVLLRSPK